MEWYRDCCASRFEEATMPEDRERRNENQEDIVGRADERDERGERDDDEEFEDIGDEADDEEDLES